VRAILVELLRHRRSPGGMALCGCPARQDQMTDDLEDVTCPACYEAMRAAAWGGKGAHA
jgi:hypothetical protein